MWNVREEEKLHVLRRQDVGISIQGRGGIRVGNNGGENMQNHHTEASNGPTETTFRGYSQVPTTHCAVLCQDGVYEHEECISSLII